MGKAQKQAFVRRHWKQQYPNRHRSPPFPAWSGYQPFEQMYHRASSVRCWGGKYSLHVRLTHHNRTAALGLEHDVGYPIFDCVMSPTSTSKESAAYTNVDVNQMLKESSASAPESSAWDPFAPTRGMHPRWSRHQPATSSAAATATAGTPPQPGQW